MTLQTPASFVTLATPAPGPTPQSKSTQARPIDKTWPNSFQFTKKSIAERPEGRDAYDLSAEYPQIVPARAAGLRRFNNWIKKRTLGHVARFRRLAKAERRNKKRKGPPIEEGLELTHIIYYSNQRLISLRLTHRVMEAGQMHPINYYETINYDLMKGRQLRPRDVFKRGYLKVFSASCREQIGDKYAIEYTSDEWVKEGTVPKRANFANWNIVPDGILISFEDYQTGSHAFGQPELVVPYSALKHLLTRASPAEKFLRTPKARKAAEQHSTIMRTRSTIEKKSNAP